MVRRRWSFLTLLLLAGCSPSLPGTLVGESAHFRLFVDPDFDLSTLPAFQQGESALDTLETDWADKQTMLKMPEGDRKIDYHLLTGQHISDACDVEFVGTSTPAGCELGDSLQIAAAYLPHQHELIHAYMELVAPGDLSVPFLVEGVAQSIACATEQPDAGTALTYDVPWQQAVDEAALDPAGDVYTEGGLFVRYLIRTQGIDAFVRYYRQAPRRRDPALFAENFSAFWHMTIDEVWAGMHVVNPGAATTDAPICPCSLPALPSDGQMTPSYAVHPYWTFGDSLGGSAGLAASGGVTVYDCEGVAPKLYSADVAGVGPNDAFVTIVQVADGRSHYVAGEISSASTGEFLADSCAGTTPYALPADFLSGPGNVWVLSTQVAVEFVTTYLQLQVPFSAQVSGGFQVTWCESCAFGQPSCPALPIYQPVSVSPTVGPGPLNVELLLDHVRPAMPDGWAFTSVLHLTK